MTPEQQAEIEAAAGPDTEVTVTPRHHSGAESSAVTQRRQGPHSLEEAEAQHVAARDAWVAAMRQSSSGRAADLASLAIAQQAYEAAEAEVRRWRSGGRVAVSVEPTRNALDAVVGQELAWRRTHEIESKKRPGLLARIRRRLSGR